MVQKVLLVTHPAGSTNNNYIRPLSSVRQILKRLGYQVDVVSVQDDSTFFTDPVFDSTEYDFVAYPNLQQRTGIGAASSAFIEPFAGTNMGTLPIFVFSTDNTTAWIATAVGTGTSLSSIADDDVKLKFTSTATSTFPEVNYGFMTCRSIDFPLLTTVYATEYSSSDEAALWKYDPDPGTQPPVYATAYQNGSGGVCDGVSILLQIAINEGTIPSPPKKLRSAIDIDDIPNTVNTLADITRVYNAQLSGGIPVSWGLKLGISGQGGGGTAHYENIDDTLWDFVAARTPDKGGLIYPMSHNHNWHWDLSLGSINTKAEADTEYRADVARGQAKGIKMGTDTDELNAWGYIYPPNNLVGDTALQLMSPQTVVLSDPADTTAQAGYGIEVCRVTGASEYPASVSEGTDDRVIGNYIHRGIRMVGGLFHIADGLDVAEPTTDIDGYTIRMGRMFNLWYTQGMGFDGIIFFHGTNTYDGHTLTTPVGTIWLEHCANWANFITDVHEFVHASEYASKSHQTIHSITGS